MRKRRIKLLNKYIIILFYNIFFLNFTFPQRCRVPQVEYHWSRALPWSVDLTKHYAMEYGCSWRYT
jgi:hypothetical protein